MDQILKQRLVGAIVLVSLAVLFIPVILEGPENDWLTRNQAIPQAPAIDFPLHRQPVGEPSTIPAVVEKMAIPESRNEPKNTSSELPVVTPRLSEVPPAASLPEKKTEKSVELARPPTPVEKSYPAGSWGIQVGSFGDKTNAAGLRDKLQSSKYSSFLESSGSASETVFKVIVGPYGSRKAAEKARDEITDREGLKGFLTEIGS